MGSQNTPVGKVNVLWNPNRIYIPLVRHDVHMVLCLDLALLTKPSGFEFDNNWHRFIFDCFWSFLHKNLQHGARIQMIELHSHHVVVCSRKLRHNMLWVLIVQTWASCDPDLKCDGTYTCDILHCITQVSLTSPDVPGICFLHRYCNGKSFSSSDHSAHSTENWEICPILSLATAHIPPAGGRFVVKLIEADAQKPWSKNTIKCSRWFGKLICSQPKFSQQTLDKLFVRTAYWTLQVETT